jgi:hypothetical protein
MVDDSRKDDFIEDAADYEAGRLSEDKQRWFDECDNRGEFIRGDDGEWIFWPGQTHGAISSWMLRALADELDRRNAAITERENARAPQGA